jgi:hypothetical protein
MVSTQIQYTPYWVQHLQSYTCATIESSERVFAPMLSQCANPSCGRPLTSLSEGRLFQFEIVSISVSASDDASEEFDETPKRETAHFWLCAQCAATMALSLEPVSGLRLVPVESGSPDATRPLPGPRELHDC